MSACARIWRMSSSRWRRFLAAFPANLVFPVAVFVIVRYALNPDIALSPLMVLGTQCTSCST